MENILLKPELKEVIESYGERMAKLYEDYTFFNGYDIDILHNTISLSFTHMNDKFWVDIPGEVIELEAQNNIIYENK